jgi:hypothetical protein
MSNDPEASRQIPLARGSRRFTPTTGTNRGATSHTRSSAAWSTDSTSLTVANDRSVSRTVGSAPASHRPKAVVSPAATSGR